MMTRKNPLRRIAAAASALALVGASAVAFSAPASAEGFRPPGTGTGSLTLHKHVWDGASEDGAPAGAPLKGVVFSRQSVGTMVSGVCTAPDLNTVAGWELANSIIDGFDEATGAMGVGCLIGAATEFPATATDGSTSASGLKGLYIIKETNPGPNLITAPAVPFIVSVPMPENNGSTWNFDVHAYPKNTLADEVEPTKTVAKDNTGTKLIPGATLNWTITVPLPKVALDYTELSIVDFPADGSGHSFADFGAVTLNDGTVGLIRDTDYEVDLATGTLAFTDDGLVKINALAKSQAQTLTVKVTTTVDADLPAGKKIDNQANVSLNGKSTPTDIPSSYWGVIEVTKHKKGSETKLAGAEFSIYSLEGFANCTAATAPGQPAVTSGVSDANGLYSEVLWIGNANPGQAVPVSKYCLVETKAPTGYILDSTPREFTLSVENAQYKTTYDFPNVPPSKAQLPLTGAGGTLAMTVSGLVLVGAGAGAIAVSRRRSHKA